MFTICKKSKEAHVASFFSFQVLLGAVYPINAHRDDLQGPLLGTFRPLSVLTPKTNQNREDSISVFGIKHPVGTIRLK
jgi:hypothetical protein